MKAFLSNPINWAILCLSLVAAMCIHSDFQAATQKQVQQQASCQR